MVIGKGKFVQLEPLVSGREDGFESIIGSKLDILAQYNDVVFAIEEKQKVDYLAGMGCFDELAWENDMGFRYGRDNVVKRDGRICTFD